VLLALPLCLAGASAVWFYASLPKMEGRVTVPGLTAEVRIERDRHGVPAIKAVNDRDAALALGYAHAQDRLFQMELMRRTGAGRLAEILGEPALATDKFMRGLGLYRLAERQWSQLSPELQSVLTAYAAGVNAFIAQDGRVMPPEFHLLRFTPESWKPADSLVWGKLMALQLSGNFRGALLRARLAKRLSPEELGQLFPSYPTEAPRTIAELLPADESLARILETLPEQAGPVGASNNWVLGGGHTEKGKPLLANDPHLPLSTPGPWYLARIETPGLTLTGATAPGVPFLVLGHNRRIGWGFTTTESDTEDLFIERIDPLDRSRYLAPGGPMPFETREEVFEIRGAEPVRMIVRTTRHGPVISDFDGAAIPGEREVLALAAPFLAEDDRSPEALFRMNRAENWAGFDDALRNLTAPQQNIVYADTGGTIAFTAPARVPIRARGNGSIPVPGWSGEYDWTGFIPFEELPRSVNAASGRYVSANNKIVPESYPYFLGGDWDLPNRAERIGELLDASPRQSAETTAAIQADTVSLAARRLLPLLLQAPPADARAEAAIAMLKDWDGSMAAGRPEPLLFVAWLRELNRELLEPKLGDAFDAYWGLRPSVIANILTRDTAWCGTEPGACGQRIAHSLLAALTEIEGELGPDMAKWRWDGMHVALFPNPVLSRIPLLGKFFTVKIQAEGGDDTINRGAMAISSREHPFADIHAASLRMVLDFADLDSSRFMIAPGQSGNPLSPHYADLLKPWRNFAWLHPATEKSVAVLALTPPPMP